MDLRPLIFMPALVGAVVFGFVFLLFLCNYYLSTVEGTAAGAKEVAYEHLDFIGGFGTLFYLGWLVGLWLGPALVVGRALTPGTDSAWLKLLAPLGFLWLCYPVSQLSSMSASSRWVPLTPDVFARLARKPFVVLQFLGLTAVVLAVFGVSFRWAFQTEGEWHLLFVGAPLLCVMVLLYARLLGRLAFVLRFTKGLFPPPRRKKRVERSEPDTKPDPAPSRARAQPRDLPPIETPEGELAGYNVRFEDESPPMPRKRVRAESHTEPAGEPVPEPQPRRRRPTPESAVERGRVWTEEDDAETEAYGVREAEVQPAEVVPDVVVKPNAEEVRLLSRSDSPRKPQRVWGSEVWGFLGHPGTITALVVASGLCGVVGAMVRVARQFNPTAGGE